jgi:hypothetical protein
MKELKIPRKEVLEARQRTVIKRLSKLQSEYEAELACLEAEEAEVQMLINWHGYSQARKALWASILEIPEVSGIYEISVGRVVVYVGESVNLQKRCCDHFTNIVSVSGAGWVPQNKLYVFLAQENPDDISFTVIQTNVDDKRDRLALEKAQIERMITTGNPLFNIVGATSTGKSKSQIPTIAKKKLVASIEAWENLLDYMSPEIRASGFIRTFNLSQ